MQKETKVRGLPKNWIIEQYENNTDINEVMRIDPLFDKWLSFNWKVDYCDGNNILAVASILENLARLEAAHNPKVIIANTVKGKGVSVWEKSASHELEGEELKKGIEEWRKRHGT